MKSTEKLIPINLHVLRIDKLKPFDLFLKVNSGGNQHYVLYSRKGTYFTNKIRENLIQNNIETIYVPEKHRDIYQQYVEDNLGDIIKDADIPPEEKSEIVYDSSKYVMERLFENPRAEMISRTQKNIHNIVDMILSDRQATHQLIRITQYDYYTYTHSINVGVFGVAFARELMQDVDESYFYKLGLGFFLHDIGKSQLPIDVLNKPGPLSEDEWNLMKTHPEKGYKILQDSGYMNKETSIIVLQHHERADGSGYPKGLSGESIHTFAKICAVADTFDAMTTNRCYQNPCSAYDSLNYIKNSMLKEYFDQEFFEKFVFLFAPNGA